MSLARRLYNAAPAPLRALVRYAHWLWSVRRRLPAAPDAGRALPPVQGPDGPVQAATIATYFPNVDMKAAGEGRFRSCYWESLHDALDGAFKKEGAPWVRWLFIRFPAPQLSLEQCIALRDRFRQKNRDGASFHYLEEFLTPSRPVGRPVPSCCGYSSAIPGRSGRLARPTELHVSCSFGANGKSVT